MGNVRPSGPITAEISVTQKAFLVWMTVALSALVYSLGLLLSP